MTFMQHPVFYDKQALAVTCIPVLIETIQILGEQLSSMDKEIKKVKKEMDTKMNRLVKMDKPRDAKLEKCSKVIKKVVKKAASKAKAKPVRSR